jgi:hypothetical protein
MSVGGLSFPANVATATVTLTANNDTEVEGDETATLTVTDGATYDVGTPSSAFVTIVSDE